MTIGILSIQGDFAAHAVTLQKLGAQTLEVRTLADLRKSDALILPGGESTTQLQFLQEEGLFDAIRQFAAKGHPIFGTCAGAILLAAHVKNPPQPSLALLDITVLRNGYGRQLASDVFFGPCTLKKGPLEMVFIRGPIIESLSPDITVLAKLDGSPTLVQKDNLLAATFHPELTDDPTVHQHFLSLISKSAHSTKTTAAKSPRRKQRSS